MSRQYKRQVELVVGKAGTGLLLTGLRISFEVTKAVTSEPNNAVIKIYNLTPTHAMQLKENKNDVFLKVGYGDDTRQIFTGNIIYSVQYYTGNDYITELTACDGDLDYTTAIVNETLAAGTNFDGIIDRVTSNFSAVTKGQIVSDKVTRIRGKVLSGDAKDVLNAITKEVGATWSIQDGKLVVMRKADMLPNEAVLLNSKTGLLGAPELSEQGGITAKCLLNPAIQPNCSIKLDESTIRVKAAATTETQIKRLPKEGIYKVFKVTHKGDNYGKDWISSVECIVP